MATAGVDGRPLTLDDLAAHLASGCKPTSDFRVGSEHEKLVYRLGSHEPAITRYLLDHVHLRAGDIAIDVGANLGLYTCVIGVSEATVSRMKSGKHALEANGKPFELAVLLVRLYRSLDSLIGGDDIAARAWLSNTNTVLGAAPLELIQSVSGLMNVIQYLDARRAVV